MTSKAALDSLPYSPAALAGTDYRPGRTCEADPWRSS